MAAFEQQYSASSASARHFEWARSTSCSPAPMLRPAHGGLITKLGVSASDTTDLSRTTSRAVFSTIRGFSFPRASHKVLASPLRPFQGLNSAEYLFSLTADYMIRATFFCRFGTVEGTMRSTRINSVLRPVRFPHQRTGDGPAHLAFDFAFPSRKPH